MIKLKSYLVSILTSITIFLSLFLTTSLLSAIFQKLPGVKGILNLIFGTSLETVYFTTNELLHMQDVRLIFIIAEVILLFAVLLLIYLQKYQKAVLTKQNAKITGIILTSITLITILAFILIDSNTLWIFLHDVLFPQGNHGFASTSLIKTLYPDTFFFKIAIAIILELLLAGITLISIKFVQINRPNI